MDFAKIESSELQKRLSDIAETAEGCENLDEVEEEARAIREELEARVAEEARKAAIRQLVIDGEGEVKEERIMPDVKEIRNSKEYISAYANYIKSGRDEECRKILTTNAEEGGILPVPEIIENTVRTAWERDDIMNRVRTTFLKGNVKVGFELSATGAVIHKEGDEAPQEEEITLGIVTMIPQTIKKWISVSDEALDMDDGEFLAYIYDELTYRIAKKCAEILITMITELPAAPTAESVSAAKITEAPALGTVAGALANLTGEATRPVIIMNRLTWAAFKTVQYDANYPVDPFEGLEVLFTDALPAYTTAATDKVYMIVGDLFAGAQANYPGGSAIRIKMNDLSRAKEDLVEFVGRRYVGMGIVRDKAFALVAKPAAG